MKYIRTMRTQNIHALPYIFDIAYIYTYDATGQVSVQFSFSKLGTKRKLHISLRHIYKCILNDDWVLAI